MADNTHPKTILLVIAGGIAAYKSLELIRLLRKAGHEVRCILTSGGAQFVTPLSVASLSEHEVYTDLWSLKDETEMGHIRLSREADLVVVAPASANLIAKMAWGLADDLASTTLLAANKPILIAPAMNQEMWANTATQNNITALRERGVLQIGPADGDMACGETGTGRMAEPSDIMAAIEHALAHAAPATLAQKKSNHAYLTQTLQSEKPLTGLSALVTAGPTFEAIDPVRFIGNRSSGKQGYAIAEALRDAGAYVTLITGPVALPTPHGIKTINIESAADMLAACERSLPADIAVCAAAVSDWRAENASSQKIKKSGAAPALTLTENPDILKTISHHAKRPKLVIGFAAETENLLENAQAKLLKKGCDWIIANDVSTDTFGADQNHVWLITETTKEEWPRQSKADVARALTDKISARFFC